MAERKINHDILEKVGALHRTGKRQKEIGRILGLSRSTTYRAQALLGLDAWQGVSEEQEKEILKLRQIKRWGASRISAHLAVSEYQVCQIIKKYRLRRRLGEPGYKFHPTTAQFIKIMHLALAHPRKYSIREIARLVGTPYKPTLKICHRVTECERFLSTRTLDSYLPMKSAQNTIGQPKQNRDEVEMTMLVVVDTISRVFDGMHDTALVAFCVQAYIAIYRRAKPEVFLGPIELQKIRAYFEPRFQQAVGVLRAAEAAVESGQVN